MLYHIDIGERDYFTKCIDFDNDDIEVAIELCKEIALDNDEGVPVVLYETDVYSCDMERFTRSGNIFRFGCYRQDSHVICNDDPILFYTSLDVFNGVKDKRSLKHGL